MGSLFEIGGLISGIDTGSLIDGILAIQRRPITQLANKQIDVDREAAAVADIGTRVSDLSGILTSLKIRSNINAKSISTAQSSTSTALLTVTASADAANGVHKVTIKQLATATKAQSTGFIGLGVNSAVAATGATTGASGSGLRAAVTAGTFTINGPSGTASITVTAGDTLTTIISNINAQTGTTGVTATLVNDSEARPNLLQLSVASGNVTVGAGADTSNLLDVMNLSGAIQSGLTLTSTHNVGIVQVTADLKDARFKTALSASTGTFKINGVSFTYDETADSLNDVISEINSSTAGVTASYDTVLDRFVLTSKTTGTETISLQDDTGNFLAATGVLSATQTLGQNSIVAIDTVNNGADITRASNTITDVIAGVTLTLGQADAANQVTVTIAQDSSSASSLISDFVANVNALLDFIASRTAFDSDTQTAAILLGDSGVNGIASSVRSTVLGNGDGLTGQYKSLQDVGITTGTVGTDAGSANTIQIDTTKLIDALNANPDAVADLLTARATAAVLDGGGIGNITTISGSPSVKKEAGKYTLTIATIVGDPATDPQTATLTFYPTGRGVDVVKTVTLTPGASQTNIIEGMTINLAATLAVGSDSVSVTVPVRGIAQILDDYVDGVLGADGLFDARADAATAEINDLEDRIVRLESRLDEARERLVRQFARLEATLAQLQGQQQFITAQLSALSNRSRLGS